MTDSSRGRSSKRKSHRRGDLRPGWPVWSARFLPTLLLTVAFGCAPEVHLAHPPLQPDSGTLAIRCGSLIDGLSEVARPNVEVFIREGRIVAVGPNLDIPARTPLLDLSELTCLPGLIDMHTHVTDRAGDTEDLSVFFRRGQAEQRTISRANARATLLAGFTTIRNVGAYVAWSGGQIRDEINRGAAVGPRIQDAGFYLTIPGGGGDLLIPGVREAEIPGNLRMGVARGPEAFRAKALEAIRGGADFIKIIASGAVLSYGAQPGEPEMTPGEIAAVVEAAHAAGVKVAAHAHGAQSIREAILAGVDTIEHASMIDDEGIELARQRGVALTMDVYNGDYIDSEGRLRNWPREFLEKNAGLTELQRKNFEKAVRAQAPIVYGTDSAVYPHGDNARQFRIMVERGMTPMQAIQSATSVAAEFMGWSDRVGALTPGRYGDLIAVQGDPLTDVTVLESVRVVVKGGMLFQKAP